MSISYTGKCWIHPFLGERFALCCRAVVLSVLSCFVCNVGVLWHLWPKGWMHQDETWHAGRPQPWPQCVTWGPSSPSPKGLSPPIFGPYLLWPNGWMDQDVTWYKGRLRPMPHCARQGRSSPPRKVAQQPPPLFGPCLLWPRSPISATAATAEILYEDKCERSSR